MHILVTNDDSYDSPLLHILHDILIDLGHKLTCVIPASEQSWKGKAMTRFGKMTVNQVVIGDRTFNTFSGTPADCVNFGIHNLCTEKPELVISGTNLGYNASLGFVFSSGTVGGALEAYLAGVPALSLSQKLNKNEYLYWNKKRKFKQQAKEKYFLQTKKILEKISLQNFAKTKDLWALEFPDELSKKWKLCKTYPSFQSYGSAFSESEDGTYFHNASGLSFNDEEGTDIHALANGNVALNKLDFKSLFKK